jgi:hypothetical protein
MAEEEEDEVELPFVDYVPLNERAVGKMCEAISMSLTIHRLKI